MTVDPADVLRGYLHDGDRNDNEALARWLDPDVETHSPGGVTTVGIAAQAESWTAAHTGLGELRHEVTDVVAEGELVAARVDVTGIHHGHFLGIAPTGRRIRVDQALFARVRDGRIVEMWEVVDTGAGLRQLGVLSGQQRLSPGS
ncbi:MAG: ester cyclase [Actinobacteria bacterium]|nr:ester cyclase [Actinomycetota bacterium]